MTIQRKDRDLAVTVEDLMLSQRLKIATLYYEHAPDLLKDLFLTLGEAAQQATKSIIISEYNKYGSPKKAKKTSEDGIEPVSVDGLPQYEMVPYLRAIKDFRKYNTWWKIKEGLERDIYLADPLFKLDASGRKALIEKLRGSN